MFSEELKILDRNTVKYMVDELQDELKSARTTISEKDATISEKDATISALEAEIKKLKSGR